MTKDLPEKIYQLCREIKSRRPLIHVVTNFVVMNQTANALLALGASPTMSWAREDTAHMSQISDGLCINIGTPVVDRIEVMEALMIQAQESGKPVVLDPVGSGAGPYRTGIAKQLCALAPCKIIRGNPSEICSLTDEAMADETTATRGVDSRLSVDQAKQIMVDHGRPHQHGDRPGGNSAALLNNARAIVISGHTDWVMDNTRTCAIANGDEIMGHVTGTGCILSALITAFYAVTDNAFDAAVAGVSVAGIAGEMAAQKSNGPGFFMNHFTDSLYHLSPEEIERRLNATLSGPAKGV